MNKLVCVIMGQNAEKFLPMCLESVKDADAIVYCDGGSTDKTFQTIGDFVDRTGKEVDGIDNPYDQEDPEMNGKQRNFYLEYVKKNYPGYWCLALDADEILHDIESVRNTIDSIGNQEFIISPRIHHFVGDLGHEDATRDKHYVPNRLFKIGAELKYTEVEHSVLTVANSTCNFGLSENIHIWHLRECLGVFETQKKHENNVKKSNIHTEGYLNWWHMSMLLGTYPRKPVYYGELPELIKRKFLL